MKFHTGRFLLALYFYFSGQDPLVVLVIAGQQSGRIQTVGTFCLALETASNFIHQPPEKLARALDKCIETEELCVKMFDGVPYIYLPDLLAAEQDIAHRLAILARRGKNTARDLDRNLQVLELTQGFAYAPLQREAIRKAMTENCLVLTGGPGTGKTTTVNAILLFLLLLSLCGG